MLIIHIRRMWRFDPAAEDPFAEFVGIGKLQLIREVQSIQKVFNDKCR